jgi:hypothetical protein
MGWSHQEELLCIQEDGMVLIYDMFGNYQHTFSMGEVKFFNIYFITIFYHIHIIYLFNLFMY